MDLPAIAQWPNRPVHGGAEGSDDLMDDTSSRKEGWQIYDIAAV
jgi:hypothetical protein